MARDTEKPPAGASPQPKRPKKSGAPLREDDAAALNAIERSRAPARGESKSSTEHKRSIPPGAAEKDTRDARSRAVPDEIRERFIGIGVKYYFPDGVAAFTDHGAKLSTRSENTEVIRSLIAIAQAREWGQIKVTGTERFRKEAWFAARLVGLEVRGYKPTEFEQERMVRAVARREAGAAGREPNATAAEGGDRPTAAS